MYRRIILFILCFQAFNLRAMVYDNRYFPLYWRTFSRTECKPSNLTGDIIIFTGNSAYINEDESSGIPEVWGLYDQNRLAAAIADLGRMNPIIGTQFQQYLDQPLIWNMKGKIQGQGVAFTYNQQLTDNVSIGATWFGMHVFSRIEFMFENQKFNFNAEQLESLDNLRRSMQASVGLDAPKFSRAGFSDIDMFVRFGNLWYYTRKFRRIDAGVRTGILIPTGLTRNINNPASVSFGGNGFWGIYGCIDLELEMKEDWKIGMWLRMSKRFTREKQMRLTLADEQPLFAVFPTQARIDPGLTFIASPYVLFEDLRDGLGIQGKYTIVIHDEDSVSWANPMPQGPQPRLKLLNEFTSWNAEYITLNVFYDFARVRLEKLFAPIVSFMWDIPVRVLLAKRVSKTNRISLGVSFGF